MTQYLIRHPLEAFVVEGTAMAPAEEVVFWDQAQSRSFAGRAAVEAVWQALFADGFAEVRIEAHTLITDDTAAALEFTFRGWHRGRFMGIPPTGREVVIPNGAVLLDRSRTDPAGKPVLRRRHAAAAVRTGALG